MDVSSISTLNLNRVPPIRDDVAFRRLAQTFNINEVVLTEKAEEIRNRLREGESLYSIAKRLRS